jgi:hypothetical protein
MPCKGRHSMSVAMIQRRIGDMPELCACLFVGVNRIINSD